MTIIMTLIAPTINSITLLTVVKIPVAPNRSVAWSIPRAELAPSIMDISKMAYVVEVEVKERNDARNAPLTAVRTLRVFITSPFLLKTIYVQL